MQPPLAALLLFVNCTVGGLFILKPSLRISVLCDRGVKVVVRERMGAVLSFYKQVPCFGFLLMFAWDQSLFTTFFLFIGEVAM